MDSLFLDANVLFSAAYRPGAGVRKLWEVSGARLVTSTYAVAEANRNLKTPEQRADLDSLLREVRVLDHRSGEERQDPEDLESMDLPDKDTPIMMAAVDARATHLITGDSTHFGPYYGEPVAKVLILPPAEYPRRSSGSEAH